MPCSSLHKSCRGNKGNKGGNNRTNKADSAKVVVRLPRWGRKRQHRESSHVKYCKIPTAFPGIAPSQINHSKDRRTVTGKCRMALIAAARPTKVQ